MFSHDQLWNEHGVGVRQTIGNWEKQDLNGSITIEKAHPFEQPIRPRRTPEPKVMPMFGSGPSPPPNTKRETKNKSMHRWQPCIRHSQSFTWFPMFCRYRMRRSCECLIMVYIWGPWVWTCIEFFIIYIRVKNITPVHRVLFVYNSQL